MSYSVRYYYDKFFSGIIDNVVNVNEESRLFFFWQAIISRRNKIACSLFVNIPFTVSYTHLTLPTTERV